MVVLVLVAAFVGLTQLYTDVLWYDQLGYLSVFVTENVTKIVIFVVAAVLVAVWLRRGEQRTWAAARRAARMVAAWWARLGVSAGGRCSASRRTRASPAARLGRSTRRPSCA